MYTSSGCNDLTTNLQIGTLYTMQFLLVLVESES